MFSGPRQVNWPVRWCQISHKVGRQACGNLEYICAGSRDWNPIFKEWMNRPDENQPKDYAFASPEPSAPCEQGVSQRKNSTDLKHRQNVRTPCREQRTIKRAEFWSRWWVFAKIPQDRNQRAKAFASARGGGQTYKCFRKVGDSSFIIRWLLYFFLNYKVVLSPMLPAFIMDNSWKSSSHFSGKMWKENKNGKNDVRVICTVMRGSQALLSWVHARRDSFFIS